MSGSSRGHPAEVLDRLEANPVLTACHWPYPVNTVMNAGATTVDGETVLLCRVEDRRGISHLSVARSPDGLTDWRVDPEPFMEPRADHALEMWGLEDPRVTRVDELGGWVIAYTSYGPTGPAVTLALTTDFRTVTRLGVACPPEDKNAALLPRRVDGHFVLYHRPSTVLGKHADVWLSRSTDLRSWLAPEPVLAARPGMWDSTRVGMGPPPLETPLGWLAIYHGVRDTVAGQVYRVGVALFDLEDPARVLRRSSEWVLGPSRPYELMGDVPGVVFPCGWVHEPQTGEVRIYYGAADTCVAVAVTTVDRLLSVLDGVPPSAPEPDGPAPALG